MRFSFQNRKLNQHNWATVVCEFEVPVLKLICAIKFYISCSCPGLSRVKYRIIQWHSGMQLYVECNAKSQCVALILYCSALNLTKSCPTGRLLQHVNWQRFAKISHKSHTHKLPLKSIAIFGQNAKLAANTHKFILHNNNNNNDNNGNNHS